MNRVCLFVLFAALLLSPPVKGADNLEPSKAEEQAFRLSLAKVQSMANAYCNLFDLIGNDPKLTEAWRAEWRRAKQEENANGRDDVSATTKRILQLDNRIGAAFSKAGTNPKETGMTMEAIVGSLLGASMAEAAHTQVKLPPGPARDNLAFAQAHRPEIMAALKQIGNTLSKYPQLKGEDEDSDSNSHSGSEQQ